MTYNSSKRSLIADYYSQHYEDLKLFVAVRLRYADDTEDLLQNVFLRLLQMEQMITPQTLSSLVYTIARNLICDYWRRRHLMEEYGRLLLRRRSGALADDVEMVYSVNEITAMLEHGIARLTDKQRPIYCMHIFEGKQVSEISHQLGLNYKNVEHRLGDARKTVRQYMKRMLA